MRALIQDNAALSLAIGGSMIGFAFGAIVHRTNFCAMGSISDFVVLGDTRRFRAWLLASGVALAGTQILAAAGVVPLQNAMYLSANFNWFGNLLGGLMFGFGMVFAGGCASRNLVRLGGGDLRALVVLIVMGLFAYMAAGGILGPLRAWLDQATSIDLTAFSRSLTTQSLGDIVGVATRLGPVWGGIITTVVVAGAIAASCFGDANFRNSPMHMASGVGIGLCVVAGWALTGLAFDELSDKPVSPISLTYVRPTGDTIEWLQRFTAGPMPGFGVATVLGTLAGAFAAAKARGRAHLTTFSDVGDTRRSLLGAALMGTGGVMALGCTVGQAVTGFSTLAIGSFLTFGALVAGGMAAIKRLDASLTDEA